MTSLWQKESGFCVACSLRPIERRGSRRALCQLERVLVPRCLVPSSRGAFFLLLFFFLSFFLSFLLTFLFVSVPQWGAADAEIKVPFSENTELKRSLFKAWSRSVYSHTCYAYCWEFLPCLCLSFRPIHLHFFQTSPDFSCVGCG